MTATERTLTLDDAHRIVAEHGFPSTSAPAAPPRLGIEIELHTVRTDEPDQPVDFELVESTATGLQLPGQSRLTFEPGGQVELSSQPLPAFEAGDAIIADANVLTAGLREVGVGLVGIGLLPGAPRARELRLPRYEAMEAHFDAFGPAGRTMMRQTAALQVNVDLGAPDESPSRWRTAHALGPLLAAVFANSPFIEDSSSGWASNRLAVWLAIEAGRTKPVGAVGTAGAAWAEYSLRAPLMCIRASDDQYVPVCEPLSFADWIVNGHALGWPTEDDLAYHLTTLFPPIRPRGWLELRMIDSLPLEWSIVPAAITVALLDDAEATRRIAPVLAPLEGRWEDAARDALHHPDFARAACECFGVALDALARLDAPRRVVDAVERYRERYVSRERCPADDLLDSWRTTGRMIPELERAATHTTAPVG